MKLRFVVAIAFVVVLSLIPNDRLSAHTSSKKHHHALPKSRSVIAHRHVQTGVKRDAAAVSKIVASAPTKPATPAMTQDEFVEKLQELIARAGFQIHKTGTENEYTVNGQISDPVVADASKQYSLQVNGDQLIITETQNSSQTVTRSMGDTSWQQPSSVTNSMDLNHIYRGDSRGMEQAKDIINVGGDGSIVWAPSYEENADIYVVELWAPISKASSGSYTSTSTSSTSTWGPHFSSGGVMDLYFQDKEDADELVALLNQWGSQHHASQ